MTMQFPTSWRAVAFLLLPLATTQGQILDWEEAFSLGNPASSRIVALDSLPTNGPNQTVVGVGPFQDNLNFAGSNLPNPSGDDGFVILWERTAAGNWTVKWVAHASSDPGNARINDVIISNDGHIWITGEFQGNLTLEGSAFTFTTPVADAGFIAQLDPNDGSWINAWSFEGMRGQSIGIDLEEHIYITGPFGLGRKYTSTGTLLWQQPHNANLPNPTHLVVNRNAVGQPVFVTGSADGGNANRLGRSQIILTHPPLPIAPNVQSGWEWHTSGNIDADLAISQFDGGTVRVIGDTASIITVPNPGTWNINVIGPNEIEIIGGITNDPGDELIVQVRNNTDLEVRVTFDAASQAANGGDYDYHFHLTEFNLNGNPTVHSFVAPQFNGVFQNNPYTFNIANLNGSGVDFTFSNSPDWAPPHQASYRSAAFTQPLGGASDIFLAALDPDNGRLIWHQAGGSDKEDEPGGIAFSQQGRLSVAFSADGFPAQLGGQQTDLPPATPINSTHSFTYPFEQSGQIHAGIPLGFAQAAGSTLVVSDISYSPTGNLLTAVTLNGNFEIDGFPEIATNKMATITVDPAGKAYCFLRTGGTSVDAGLAVTAPADELILLGGEFSGGTANQIAFGTINLPASNQSRGVLGILEAEPGVNGYIVRHVAPQAGGALQEVIQAVRQAGGKSYHLLDYPQGNIVGISAYVRDQEITGLQNNPNFIVEPDNPIRPQTSTSDWAHAHLNDVDAVDPGSGYPAYAYPTTHKEVIFYLIDTAVDNPAGYFDANANLTLESSILVRGDGDFDYSTEFEHGTRMMSLVVGPTVGVAQGTPVTAKSYDIYPTGATTSRVSLAASAILSAAIDRQTNHATDPSVLMLASGADSSSTSLTLKTAIEYARDAKMLVVVAAGNSAADMDTAPYIPGSYGAQSGIVTVGGIDETNALYSLSNHGSPVDIYAPGEEVSVVDDTTGTTFTTSDGTSPASAMTAGAGVIIASTNPYLGPTDLETILIGDGETRGGYLQTQVNPTTTTFDMEYADWACCHGLDLIGMDADGDDPDGDGWINILEYLRDTNPNTSDFVTAFFIAEEGSTTGTTKLSFDLASYLYDSATIGTLRDGTTYAIQSSVDLGTTPFAGIAESLSGTSNGNGTTEISVEISNTADENFYRPKFTR